MVKKDLTPEERKIINSVSKRNISSNELESILKDISKSPKRSRRSYKDYIGGKPFKIGIISDTHIGNENFREGLLAHAGETFRKNKIEKVYHCGDILDGMSGRDGQIYELNQIGYESQMREASKLFKKHLRGLRIFGINGNHDLWYKRKGNIGVNVSAELQKSLQNYIHLGDEEADINFGKGITMKIFHPGDGTAYAVSYKLQKLIESFEGGKKPSIVAEGHYHKSLYMFTRNVHGIEAGTLCGQTQWMRGKKIPAHLGFWTLEIEPRKRGKGVGRISPTFYPAYD